MVWHRIAMVGQCFSPMSHYELLTKGSVPTRRGRDHLGKHLQSKDFGADCEALAKPATGVMTLLKGRVMFCLPHAISMWEKT